MYRPHDRGGRHGGFRGGGGGGGRGGGGGGGGRGGFRGGVGFRGRGGGHAYPDMGFCVLHKRKRLRSEMVPMPGEPGRFRCDPGRECYEREEVPEATCHLHNRLRKVSQMREVRPGVWECLPGFLCRQYGNGQMGVPVMAAPTVADSARDYQPAQRRQRREPAEAASPWAPSAAGRPAPLAGAEGGVGADAGPRALRARRTGYGAERKVWCARHGKHLYVSQCDSIGDCCFMCTDHTLCLSTPLEDAEDLGERECKELLCSRHNTLRSVAFLRLNDGRNGYQCTRGHACRGVTLPQMVLSADALGDGADGYAAQADEDDGFAPHDAYLEANQGGTAADAYAAPSGREAVSSFFA